MFIKLYLYNLYIRYNASGISSGHKPFLNTLVIYIVIYIIFFIYKTTFLILIDPKNILYYHNIYLISLLIMCD